MYIYIIFFSVLSPSWHCKGVKLGLCFFFFNPSYIRWQYLPLFANRVLNFTVIVVFNPSSLIATAVIMWNVACLPQVNGLLSLLRYVKHFLVAFNCHINRRSWSWEAPCKTRLLAENGLFSQFESGQFCECMSNVIKSYCFACTVHNRIGHCYLYATAYLRKFWINCNNLDICTGFLRPLANVSYVFQWAAF